MQRYSAVAQLCTRDGSTSVQRRTFRCTPRERSGVVVSVRPIRVLSMVVPAVHGALRHASR